MADETQKWKVQIREPYKTESDPNDYITDWTFLQTLNDNHIYRRNQIDRFSKFTRFGFLDPYNTNSITKEYLFFTKMDLHLFTPRTQDLNPELSNNPFFIHCYNNYTDTMNQLQWSVRHMTDYSPFCNLLTNTVSGKLDLDDISIEKLETGGNIMGVKMEYPLPTVTSNNLYSFNLEFEDTKFLDVYMFFRIWYEYELLKARGLVTPPDQSYTINKVLHDQMAVYKFIVGEDGETIIHWTKLWGVYPTTIPRSTFSEMQDGPTKLSVSFNSQWVEDMDPNILSDFQALVKPQLSRYKNDIRIYNYNTGTANGEWCHVPYLANSTLHGRNTYKLKWR